MAGPTQHSQGPIVTGTSVLAAKFKDGVVIAADNLGTNAACFCRHVLSICMLTTTDSLVWIARSLH